MPQPDTYPRKRMRWIAGFEYTLLLMSESEIWRVRDVVDNGRDGWEPAAPFADHWKPRMRVFTRCDVDGRLLHPVDRRATPVGEGTMEFSHDLDVLLEQLARAERWTP